MPQGTYEKAHTPKALVYDIADGLDLGLVTVLASQANTVIQTYAVLPFAAKIFGAWIVGSNAASGITAFNITNGIGAENGIANTPDNSETIGYPPTTVPVGGSVFTTDQAVTLGAYVPQSFAASVFDAVWAKGTLITLRLVTGATVNGTVRVRLAAKYTDIQPQTPGKNNRPMIFSDL